MPDLPSELPTYRSLPYKEGNPPKTAWGLFGDDDEVGMFNLQTPERIAAAARLVRKGAMFPVNWDQSQPNPPLYNRGAVRHTVMRRPGFGHHGDDVLDNLYTQQSSQWDALTHVGDFEHGFWGGVTAQWLADNPKTPKLGIEHWAKRGIAGRCILLDLGRWFESQGSPLPMDETVRIGPGQVESCRAAQGVEFEPGDVVLIRIGWIGWYEQQSAGKRQALSQMVNLAFPGLECSDDMAEYFFDRHPSAICSDNPALEAWPPPNFADPDGFLHHWIIGRFGMAIGEMFVLDQLAADCAADGVYEAFFAAAPLNVRGGTGSPPNGLAIK